MRKEDWIGMPPKLCPQNAPKRVSNTKNDQTECLRKEVSVRRSSRGITNHQWHTKTNNLTESQQTHKKRSRKSKYLSAAHAIIVRAEVLVESGHALSVEVEHAELQGLLHGRRVPLVDIRVEHMPAGAA